ncbi:MAG TPA: PaaI family thioesterase [Caldimonas sp.]|nr:PaaI family thioesterase [Caldimonas sp.]HEX2541347.1 PaaI family thioesterase [Caldimonas sp.]
MTVQDSALARIRAINETAAFNRWCGIDVLSADAGRVEIGMPWREEAGQYAGFLHAGLVGALIDTACGFAAATLVGRVLASHYTVNCLRPAVGERFVARARVVKPGKTLVFTACELYAVQGGEEKLVATGETLLSVVGSERTS